MQQKKSPDNSSRATADKYIDNPTAAIKHSGQTDKPWSIGVAFENTEQAAQLKARYGLAVELYNHIQGGHGMSGYLEVHPRHNHTGVPWAHLGDGDTALAKPCGLDITCCGGCTGPALSLEIMVPADKCGAHDLHAGCVEVLRLWGQSQTQFDIDKAVSEMFKLAWAGLPTSPDTMQEYGFLPARLDGSPCRQCQTHHLQTERTCGWVRLNMGMLVTMLAPVLADIHRQQCGGCIEFWARRPHMY